MTYDLIRSRRKTLAIHVKQSGEVEVRAPLRLAKREIERFVAEKAAWIEQKRTQAAALRPTEQQELPPSRYASGEFKRTTREFVRLWEEKLGAAASFVGFRAMTTRWGSCTLKTRRIRLNAALEYCPRECLEYVVVHELAHLRENNHSPRFWAIVADALPDYKTRQARLRELQWILSVKKERERQ